MKAAAKYFAIFQIQLTNRLAYKGDLALQSLQIVMFMFIFFQLWRATYQVAGDTSGAIAGLRLSDTLWYLLVAEAITLSRPRVSRLTAAAVKEGSIAYMLNKPYHFILYQYSSGLGDAASSLFFNLLIGGGVVWLMVGLPPSPAGWLPALLGIVLGMSISFCMEALIGLAAFIAEDVSAIDWIYNKFILLLGGVLIPLDFFPEWLQRLTTTLPFAYATYAPARFFVEPTLERFTSLIGGQLAWLAVIGLVLWLVFRKSVMWLNINGG